jgi:hypothetical protein
MRLSLIALLPCIAAIPGALLPDTAQLTDTATAMVETSSDPPLVQKPGQAISTPFERFGATTVVDSKNGKLYSFGGMERGGALPSNDVLEFDIASKRWGGVVSVYGDKPPGRFFHSATVSADGKTMYITGGTPCFSRIYMKSLEFDDSNGQYVTQRQHATTEALSIEHSQGLDDVYSFTFATRTWKQLKAATDPHVLRCKAASNVFYKNSGDVARPLALTIITAVATLLYTLL